MHLKAGQTVVWSKISDTECRLVTAPAPQRKADPIAAIGFAARHGLVEGSSAEWMKLLRAGEEED